MVRLKDHRVDLGCCSSAASGRDGGPTAPKYLAMRRPEAALADCHRAVELDAVDAWANACRAEAATFGKWVAAADLPETPHRDILLPTQ